MELLTNTCVVGEPGSSPLIVPGDGLYQCKPSGSKPPDGDLDVVMRPGGDAPW